MMMAKDLRLSALFATLAASASGSGCTYTDPGSGTTFDLSPLMMGDLATSSYRVRTTPELLLFFSFVLESLTLFRLTL